MNHAACENCNKFGMIGDVPLDFSNITANVAAACPQYLASKRLNGELATEASCKAAEIILSTAVNPNSCNAACSTTTPFKDFEAAAVPVAPVLCQVAELPLQAALGPVRVQEAGRVLPVSALSAAAALVRPTILGSRAPTAARGGKRR
eukprot:CAMPEP_0175095978 /NCGR_PEP_ID=MMETSP0086_2-20121207/4469_1 /TAXON_ID=136419 /ORGANISM="Unknown Unknown, Strain D1" /LENGTH=147 /DNA_ID=CAMNT_0016369313 /DNA_START=47 /DNA_END=491 /DNA_ORIENTATION=+